MLDHFISLFTTALDEYQISENKEKNVFNDIATIQYHANTAPAQWGREADFSFPPLLGHLTPFLETS